MKIKIDHLTRTFGRTRAVDDISFEFESGNIFGFIGPNGAGKTTTIKVMATIDMPDSGDVYYDGISTVYDPEIVRRTIGYMPDSLPEYRDIQVWEYLDFFARSFGIKGEKRRKVLAEIEEFTSVGEIRYKFLSALSKGMKQRVSLARALVHNPEVLLMDEPAAGLDPRARLELRSLLKELAARKKAIFLSSHILSELQDICDGAVIIEKGKILSAGTLAELNRNLVRPKAAANAEDGGEAEILVELIAVSIRCTGDCGEAVRLKLLEHPAVREAELLDSSEVVVSVEGDDAVVSQVVGTLFAAGLGVAGFQKREAGLEEIFMRVTTGGVQ